MQAGSLQDHYPGDGPYQNLIQLGPASTCTAAVDYVRITTGLVAILQTLYSEELFTAAMDYVRITTGLGAILQTLCSEELWGYLAMRNNVKQQCEDDCVKIVRSRSRRN